MNIKELTEQRNGLFEQADEIINTLEKEDRSASSEETNKLNELKMQIVDVTETINAIESQKNEKTTEAREMENNREAELRGMEQFLRKQQGEERAEHVNTTADGAGVIPVNIAQTIIEKMESFSNVFAQAQRFNSVSGELRIPRDSSTDSAGFVGENVAVDAIQLKFDYVALRQRRVGASITLTNHLVNDAGFDIVNFAINKLAKKTGEAVEEAALKGSNDNDQFEGILSTKSLALEGLNKVELPATIDYDAIVDIYNEIQPIYLNNSQFIMSRKLFSKITQLKDGNGHKYVQGGVVNGKLQQTLLGLPVVVSDQLTEADGIIFGDVSQAYGIMVKTDFKLQYVTGDTQQAKNGTQLLVFDGYMDGAVIDPQALVVAQPSVTP